VSISSFPSKTSAWTGFCKFSNLSKLLVAVRERPMASAASWCVSLNSPISRCTPPASSSGLRFSLWMFSTSAMASADESGTSRTERRDFRETGDFRRAPAPLARDDLVAVAPIGRTRMGCISPCFLIEAASS